MYILLFYPYNKTNACSVEFLIVLFERIYGIFETSHRCAPNYFNRLYTNMFLNITITLAPEPKRWLL